MTHRGFTLIELMIVLAVAAILISVGVPSFNNTIKNNRLSTQANELITSLNYARSEAIKRGTSITLNSDTTNWHLGWTINDNDDAIIRAYDAFEDNSTLISSDEVITVKYLNRGFVNTVDDITFELCDDRSGEAGRSITISITGRASMADTVCDALRQ